MRRKIFGWLYGVGCTDSFGMVFFKSSLSMLTVYSIGVFAYFLLLQGFLNCSWLSLFSILFPVILSWYGGVDVCLKNPETVKFRAEHPDMSLLLVFIMGFSLLLEWAIITVSLYGDIVFIP